MAIKATAQFTISDISDIPIQATAPINPTLNMLWFDTVNDVMKKWDGSKWIITNDFSDEIKAEIDKIQIGGVNIIPHQERLWEQGSVDNLGNQVVNNTRIRSVKKYEIIGNSDYVISSFCVGELALHFWNEDGSHNTYSSTWITSFPYTLKTPSNAKYVSFIIKKTDGSATTPKDLLTLYKFQFEKGNKPSSDWKASQEDIDFPYVAPPINLRTEKSVNHLEYALDGAMSLNVIEGNTVQNLSKLTVISESFDSSTYEVVATGDRSLLQIGKTYTCIFDYDITLNRCDGNGFYAEINCRKSDGSSLWVNVMPITKTSVKGRNIKLITIPSESFSINSLNFTIHNASGTYKISNFMILEGDWTNREIPPHFEGIQSVGEKFTPTLESGFAQTLPFLEDENVTLPSYESDEDYIEDVEIVSLEDTESEDENVAVTIPYLEGGTYASNEVYDFTLKSIGKNLFDYNSIIPRNDSSIVEVDIDGISITDTYYCGNIMKVKKNTNYYVNAERTIINGNGGNIAVFVSDGVTVGGSISIKTFGKNNGVFNSGNNDYVSILLYGGNASVGTCKFSKVQVEEGSTATSYEQYKCSEQTIKLNEPLRKLPSGVADYIDTARKKVIRKVGKVILDGSNTWGIQNNAMYIRLNEMKRRNENQSNNLVCDKLIPHTDHSSLTIKVGNGKLVAPYTISLDRYPNENWLYVYVDGIITQTPMNDYFRANPTTVYYELATSTEEDIDINQYQTQYKDGNFILENTTVNPTIDLTYVTSIADSSSSSNNAIGEVVTKVTETTSKLADVVVNLDGITSTVSSLSEREVLTRKVSSFRYVRDWLNGSTVNTGNHWVELQVMVGNTNIAQGILPTSNASGSNFVVYTDGKVDGNYANSGTGWVYLQVDLGTERTDVDMIKVWHYYLGDRGYNHKLQVSRDGITWYELFNSDVSGRYKETINGRTYILNESYTETRLKQAEQKITDDAIISTVTSTITQKVNEGIGSIQIGGTNIARNTAFLQGKWTNEGYETILEAESDKPNSKISKLIRSFSANAVTVQSPFFHKYRYKANLKKGDCITVAFDFYCEDWSTYGSNSNSNIFTIRMYDNEVGGSSIRSIANIPLSNFNGDTYVDGKWVRLYYTHTMTENLEGWLALGYYMSYDSTSVAKTISYSYREIKVEYGSKPTSWSPSPKDSEKVIQTVDVLYAESTSSTIAPTSGWQSTPPTWRDGYFIWSKTTTTLLDGTSTTTTPVCITGAKGQSGANGTNGATGQGVDSITELYKMLDTKAQQPTPTSDTGWSTTPPTWSSGKYIHTCSKIVYKNPTATSYTVPVCDSSWEAVNEIQVGGRNILLGTGTEKTVTRDYSFPIAIPMLKDREYSYSVYLKANRNTSVLVYLNDDSGKNRVGLNFGSIAITTEYKLYTLTAKCINSDEISTDNVKMRVYGASGDVITGKLTKLELGNKPTTWTPSLEDVDQAITDVNTKAEESKGKLDEMSNDNKLTASEKQNAKKEWDSIQGEYSKIIAQANSYSVSTSTYTSLYNTLNSYITPLLSNLTTTSDIVGTTFRSNFTNYYNARQDVVNAIGIKAKDRIDGVEGDISNPPKSLTTDTRITTIADSVNGVIRLDNVEGNTVQNIADIFNSSKHVHYFGTVVDGYIRTMDSSFPWFTYKDFTFFKPSTTYTFVVDVRNINGRNISVNNQHGSYMPSFTQAKNITTNGRHIFTATTTATPNTYFFNIVITNGVSTNLVDFRYIVLEGDWTNKEIPQYFEGVQSVGNVIEYTESTTNEEGEVVEIIKSKAEFDIVSNGKNLYSESIFSNKVSEVGAYVKYKIKSLKPNTEYSFTLNPNNFLGSNSYVLITDDVNYNGGNDSSGNFYVWLGHTASSSHCPTSGKFTTGNKDVYLAVVGDTINAQNLLKNFQLEEGSTTTSFESNVSQTQTVTMNEPLRRLPNGVCDYIDTEKGLVVRRIGKVVLNGSEDITNHSAPPMGIRVRVPFPNAVKTRSGVIGWCDTLAVQSGTITVESTGISNATADYGGVAHGYICRTDMTTVAQVKSWLQANPTTVLYELATPIIESCKIYQYMKQFRKNTIIVDNTVAIPTTTLTYAISIKDNMEFVNNSNHESSDKLFDHISNNYQEITQKYESSIKQEADRILSTVSNNYATVDDKEAIYNKIQSVIDQTAEGIDINFESSTKYTTEVDGKLQELIKEIKTYIRFSIEGIELGELGSPFKSLLGNEKLSFIQDGVEIAYISNNKMFITDVEIKNKLTLGDVDRGYFDWIPRTNGNLSLKWRAR